MNQPTQISRRSFLSAVTLAALGLRPGALRAQTTNSTTLVTTPSGPLRGLNVNGTRIFRGVPFAEPPVGPLRFKQPLLVKPWVQQRDALKFAAGAMQSGNGRTPISEDCLYLNIWAPEGPGPFPVFVWIHGGGFTGGYSFDPTTDGEQFTAQGIIVVTIAYRLGVFGFLDYSQLLGSDFTGSSNNGIRDAITALTWIHENIESFGGDPGRVTVGGESAGAKLTDILMGVPAARPLFHQLISESGGAERIATAHDAAAVAAGYSDLWSKAHGGVPADLLHADANDLIAVQDRLISRWPQHFPLRCELDPTLIPQLPVTTIAKGNTRGKRLLIGTNLDESAAFDGPAEIRDVTASDLGNVSVDTFESVFDKYSALYPNMTPKQLRVRALTAEEYWIPSVRAVQAHVRGGGEAWMYRLDFAETSGAHKGFAYHSLDVGMVWGKPHLDVDNGADESALGAQMHGAWAAFINGVDPSAQGLPAWPRYDLSKKSTMVLNTQSEVISDPNAVELKLWDGIL